MPTYEYRCEGCGTTVEVVQRFSDAPLTTCEACGGTLRKVYAPVGIVFKGSGFYKNDSRSASSSVPKPDGAAKPDSKAAAGADQGPSSSAPTDAGATDGGASGKGRKDPAPAGSPATSPSAATSSGKD